MKIDLLVRKYRQMNGQARYMMSLSEGLKSLEVEAKQCLPKIPCAVRAAERPAKILGMDLAEFLRTFPISAGLRPEAVKHFTTQQMGSILMLHPGLAKVVVTVHDIIPYLMHKSGNSIYQHPVEAVFDRLSLAGLKRADRIIVASEFTKQTLVENLSIIPSKIDVVRYGMDHDVFRPVTVPGSFLQRHKLNPELRYLLYVGSEIPRKNLKRLVKAFAIVKREIPDVKLIKVGTPHSDKSFRQLQRVISRHNLTEDVLFFDHLTEEDLTRFYNFADVFAFMSLYEGFGMPPLEAMACGTAVVCSNAASVPEVVGDAAIQVDPYNVEAIADAMRCVLEDGDLAAELREKGLARATQFTWARTARETVEVYKRVLAESSS